MALTCGGHCMKIMLFIFNAIFFLAGAAMLGIGIWLLVDPNISSYFEFIAVGSDDLFMAAAITITTVGALIFVIGFFGCCGACKESSCMLCVFIGLMSVIFALEIVVAVLAGVFHNEISQGLEEEMSEQAQTEVHPMLEEGNTATSLAWHHMQYDLQCCGGKGYIDYKNNSYFNQNTERPVPQSCCMLENDDVEKPEPKDYDTCKNEFNMKSDDPKQLMEDGCYMALVDWMEQKAAILIGIACGIAAIQILGIVFACCVRNQLNRKKEYV